VTVTTLDAKKALIVIDLQKGIVALATVHPIEGVTRHVAALVEAFRVLACRSCSSMSPGWRRAGRSSRAVAGPFRPAGPISSPS
jgi:nicotinamidase-related amidase